MEIDACAPDDDDDAGPPMPADLFSAGCPERHESDAERVRLLAKDDPVRALSILRETVGTWDDERLAWFALGRRGAAYALEAIARRADTFGEAAEILIRLAVHDNGGALGGVAWIFSGLFSNAPGCPAAAQAGVDERLALLAGMLKSDDVRRRRLALGAIEVALTWCYVQYADPASGNPVMQFAREPIGKEIEAYKKALRTLLGGMAALGPVEREEAARMAVLKCEELSKFPEMLDSVADAMQLLHAGSFASKEGLVRAADLCFDAHVSKMPKAYADAWKKRIAGIFGPAGR